VFIFFFVLALGWSLGRSLYLAVVTQQPVSWLNSQWVDERFYLVREYCCAVV